MTWWIVGAAAVILVTLACAMKISARNRHPADKVDRELAPSQPDQATPTSVLQLVHSMLVNKEYTTNASALLTSGSKAVSRVVLSVGFVLVLIVGIVVCLAFLIFHFAGVGPAIGGGIAIGGAGVVWASRSLWKRFSKANPTNRDDPMKRRARS
jgi:hypothetical protein